MDTFMATALQIITGLLGLSFLVFIHEMGHFLVAKKAGVKVRVFSIGFGPKIIKKQWGETLYCISAIPFGGYVAMAGESPEDAGDEPERSFREQPIRTRAAIALGGPVINLVFGFLALWVLYVVGVPERPQESVVVGQIDTESAAEKAQLMVGDTLISWDGIKSQGWEKFYEYAAMRIDQPIRLEVKRQNELLIKGITPVELEQFGIGFAGIRPLNKVIAAQTPHESSPAGAAGFIAGDTIVSMNGSKVASHADIVTFVQASQGKEIQVIVRRQAQDVALKVTPKWNAEAKKFLMGLQLGLASAVAPKIVKRNFGDAGLYALEKGWDMVMAPFNYISKMFDGGIKVKSMSGPIGIVQQIGLTWEESFAKAMWLLAFISINLGVMNLLPLAITDGGILLFLAIEWIRKKPLTREVEARIQSVAFLFFLSLFLYITFNDVLRFKLFMP